MILYSPPVRIFHVVPVAEFFRLINNYEKQRLLISLGQFMAYQEEIKVYFVYVSVNYNTTPTLWKQSDKKTMVTILALTRTKINYSINSVFVFPREQWNGIDASETASEFWEYCHRQIGVLAIN